MASVIDRAGRAGEVVDALDRPDSLRKMRCRRDICLDDPHPGRCGEVGEVLAAPGHEIIDDDDLVPSVEQPVDEVTADHARAAGYDDPHGVPLPGAAGAASSVRHNH
jgi:hypothetical protein